MFAFKFMKNVQYTALICAYIYGKNVAYYLAAYLSPATDSARGR